MSYNYSVTWFLMCTHSESSLYMKRIYLEYNDIFVYLIPGCVMNNNCMLISSMLYICFTLL